MKKRCFYLEIDAKWTYPDHPVDDEVSFFDYLHEIREGKEIDPPTGMRSAVPLGGLGAGTIEARADGRLVD